MVMTPLEERANDILSKLRYLCDYNPSAVHSVDVTMKYSSELLPVKRLLPDQVHAVIRYAKRDAAEIAGGSEEEYMRRLIQGFEVSKQGRFADRIKTVRSAIRVMAAVRYTGRGSLPPGCVPESICRYETSFRGISRRLLLDEEIDEIVDTAHAVASLWAYVHKDQVPFRADEEKAMRGIDKAERFAIRTARTVMKRRYT